MLKRLMHTALMLLLALTVAYGALVGFVWLNQDRLVYFPSPTLVQTPADWGIAYEDVWITTEDGVLLHGWFVPAEAARGAVLYFHGNGGNMSQSLFDVAAAQQHSLHMLIIDYRGYGLSEGTPSEPGLYRDAAAAWAYLTDTRNISPDEIIIMGQSLGGAVATWLAQQHTPAGLVLMSTFTAMPDVGAQHYPFLPVRLLSHNRYPTRERLPEVEVPILISHARDDEVIPFAHGQRLATLAPERTTFLELSGGHARGFASMSEAHPTEITAFLDRALPPE
jgi:hypothetical protein